MTTGTLWVLSGPSGVGKTTLEHRIINRRARTRRAVSWTTRPPRPGERDGIDYNFVPEDVFRVFIETGTLLEWQQYNGWYYGTSSAILDDLADNLDVVLVLGVDGAVALKERFPVAQTVFLAPPSMRNLEQWMRGRDDGMDEVERRRRLREAERELALADRFDHVTVSHDLDETLRWLSERMSGRPSGPSTSPSLPSGSRTHVGA